MDQDVQPGWLHDADLSLAQELYNQLSTLRARFISLILKFNNRLPLDKEGDPILPVNGEPGYWWREEEKNAVLVVMGASLDRVSWAMMLYKHLCTTVVASRIQHETTCGFL